MPTISELRLRQLEKIEAKMQALEAGGVDNWDNYDESLEKWHEENELEEKLSDLASDLEQMFGESAYKPSERGAGIAFQDDVHSEYLKLFKRNKVTFSDLGKNDE